jgi:hypothetical protein
VIVILLHGGDVFAQGVPEETNEVVQATMYSGLVATGNVPNRFMSNPLLVRFAEQKLAELWKR